MKKILILPVLLVLHLTLTACSLQRSMVINLIPYMPKDMVSGEYPYPYTIQVEGSYPLHVLIPNPNGVALDLSNQHIPDRILAAWLDCTIRITVQSTVNPSGIVAFQFFFAAAELGDPIQIDLSKGDQTIHGSLKLLLQDQAFRIRDKTAKLLARIDGNVYARQAGDFTIGWEIQQADLHVEYTLMP